MTNNSDCVSETIVCGHWVQCQLPKNHGGEHIFSVTWNDRQKGDNVS